MWKSGNVGLNQDDDSGPQISNYIKLEEKWTASAHCDEVAAGDGAEDFVDGRVGRQRAVDDVELALESLRDVVASAARVDHGADHLYVHDVGELTRLLQVIEAARLHHLPRYLVCHLQTNGGS